MYGDNQWIPVKEKLPEEGVVVLVFSEGEPIRTDFLVMCSSPLWGNTLTWSHNEVTHWMPLPKPPRKDDKEE